MNERIKQLMTKAFESSKTFEEGTCVRTEEVFEKFAELIVKDCIAEVLMYSCSSVESNRETYLEGFIDGTEQGYKDAVEQIAEGIALRYGIQE